MKSDRSAEVLHHFGLSLELLLLLLLILTVGRGWQVSGVETVHAAPTPADYRRGQPPRRWWITFTRPHVKPALPDYAAHLRPRAAPPPCYSRFEINGVSGVQSQWIA